LVTTFSKQSCPLQRIATRVTSMVTFMDGEIPGWVPPCRVHAILGTELRTAGPPSRDALDNQG
jgi:hypothetical protein